MIHDRVFNFLERNQFNKYVNPKIYNALNNGLKIIFCFGEELDDRKSGQQFEIINKQLSSTLFNMSELDWKKIISNFFSKPFFSQSDLILSKLSLP